MKKPQVSKLSMQYLLSYLFVTIVALGMMLVYVNNSFHSFHSQLLLTEYRSRLELLRETQENELDMLRAINSQLGASIEAEPFCFEEAPERAHFLIRKIASLKAVNQYASGIFLRYHEEDFVFSNLSSYSIKNLLERAVIFPDMTKEEEMLYWEDTSQLTLLPMQPVDGFGLGVKTSPEEYLTIFMPFTYQNVLHSGTTMYLVHQSVYENWFSGIINEKAESFIMDRDTLLVHSGRLTVPVEIANDAVKQGEKVLYHQGEKYHVLSLNGEMFDYSYILLIPDEELRMATSSSTRMLLLVTAAVASVSALLIVRVVQSRMKPIKLIYGLLSDRVPKGNELIEIRDGVQRLIDENNSMTSRMENLDDLQRADFARRFLTGGFSSMDEYLGMADSIHLNVDVPFYAVAIVAQPANGNYSLQAEKQNRLFNETVSGVTHVLTMNDRIALVLFAQTEDDIHIFLENRLEGMRATCMGITMSVSNAHSDYRDGQRAYLEAENAFDLRFVKGNSTLIRFSSLKENNERPAVESKKLVESLRMALRSDRADLVGTALAEFSRTMRSVEMSLFMFRCMYNDILNVINGEARARGVAIDKNYDLFRLSQCLSLDDLDQLLHDVCSTLMANRTVTEPVTAVEKAKAIMDAKFFDLELSVSAIAEEVGLSDSKLSSGFKQTYQMTPIEYITSLRMHRARYLLRTTRLTVKDIAIESGYYDISGFNRRFKAYSGMTPQQYRLNSNEESQEKNEEE